MSWWDDDDDAGDSDLRQKGQEAPPAAGAAAAARDPLDQLPTGPQAASRSIVTIYGMTGYGKTTYAARLYQDAIARGVSGTWIDTTGNNTYLARAGRSSGFRCAVAETIDGWAAHVRAAGRELRPYNVVLVPAGAQLDRFWRLVFSAGHCLLGVDEFDEYATAGTQLPEGHPLRRLLSQGRHRQVSIVSTVRVPPDAHKLLRSLTSTCISFHQVDRKYAELISSDMFRGRDRRAADWLQRLPRFCYLRYDISGRFSWGVAPTPVDAP